MQGSCCNTPSTPAVPIFSYWCGHLGTLELGSCSLGQLEPSEPCVQAPPRLAPAGPLGHASGGARGEVRGYRVDQTQVAPKALKRVDPLFHPKERSPQGPAGALFLSLGVCSAPRTLRYRHLGISGLRLPGLRAVARPGSPRLASPI